MVQSGIPKDKNGLSLGAAVWPGRGIFTSEPPETYLRKFEYQHLKLGSGENKIRLLILDRRDTFGLSGSLIHVSLVDAPPFDALSYTWDSPEAQQPIFLSGRKFFVNSNLYQALRRLREMFIGTGNFFALWIDAICIYADRHRKKTLGNLRLKSLFSKGFHFPCRINRPLFICLCVVLPILCPDLYILALKCTNFTFCRPYPKSKMKLFLFIFILLINLSLYWLQSGAVD